MRNTMQEKNYSKNKLKKYSIGIQIFTTIYALLYFVFFAFSFIESPEGSPIADHKYSPFDLEML